MALMERIFVGHLDLSNGFVDISDPYHNSNSNFSISSLKVAAGKYSCYAYKDTESGCIMCCQIVINSNKELAAIAEDKIACGKSWRRLTKSFIGVSSKTAGFFASPKPVFRSKTDLIFHPTSKLNEKGIPKCYMLSHSPIYKNKEGFFTESGIGNGAYTAHMIRENYEVIALEIRFW